MIRTRVKALGIVLEHWAHASCVAWFVIDHDRAILDTITSARPGRGHATILLLVAKGTYRQEGKESRAGIELTPAMYHVYHKVGLLEDGVLPFAWKPEQEWGRPMYFLIGNGFRRPGQRPPTSLAFHTGVKLQIWNGRAWRDSAKTLGEVTVYARWEQEPTPSQIRWAKRKLAPLSS